MTNNVDKLADVLLDAMRENSQVSVGEDGNSITFDARALARAVLLHLRDAPTEEDFLALAQHHGIVILRADWQTMFDRMLGK